VSSERTDWSQPPDENANESVHDLDKNHHLVNVGDFLRVRGRAQKTNSYTLNLTDAQTMN
jgi:hypothetical protein